MPKTMKDVVREAARMGRRGADGVKDDRLAHINASEAQMLKDAGGAGTINPKTGLQEFKYGADTKEGGATGKGAGATGNGGAGGGKGTGNPDLDSILDNDKFAGYKNNAPPAGPKNPDADPYGGKAYLDHYTSMNSPSDNILDQILGYETPADRVKAYENNPEAPHNQTYVAQVPNYPYADLAYTVASILDTPFSPYGAITALPSIGYAIANNQAPEGMFQSMAAGLGADRGPQVGENGVGYDRGGGGQAIFNGAQMSNTDAPVIEDEYTGPYDKQTTYTSDGKPPVVKKVPTSLTSTILNAMSPQPAQVVG